MKTGYLFKAMVLLSFVVSSCTSDLKQGNAVEELRTKDSSLRIADGKQSTVDNAHNSRNALDWEGTYKGVLPCADCAGIETTITLFNGGKYIKTTVYLERDEKVFREEGAFAWNAAGSTITLAEKPGSMQKYKVGENLLFHLDRDGNVITGPLADKYTLSKNTMGTRLEDKK